MGGFIHPHSIVGLLWKWWVLDLLCSALLGILMWKAWRSEASKWTWAILALWFGLGFAYALSSRAQHGALAGGIWYQFSGADCENGWRPGSGCIYFTTFTRLLVRGVSFSIGAYSASKIGWLINSREKTS